MHATVTRQLTLGTDTTISDRDFRQFFHKSPLARMVIAVGEGNRFTYVDVNAGAASYFDLPGGAVDGDENEVEALVREFVEETGMTVRPLARIAEAGQCFRKTDGAPINNVGGFWTAAQLALDPAAKVESDHELVWMPPQRALVALRHEAHAWAVAVWLRRGPQAAPYGTIA
jgi:8-oxo-dGTP diphosphatase